MKINGENTGAVGERKGALTFPLTKPCLGMLQPARPRGVVRLMFQSSATVMGQDVSNSETQFDRLVKLEALGAQAESESLRAAAEGDEALRISEGDIRCLPPGRYLLLVPPAGSGKDISLKVWR